VTGVSDPISVEVSSVELDLFGDGRRVSISQLSPGLTVIYGANESGKSTTRQLIAGGLFPYAKARSNAKVRPPTLAVGRVQLSINGQSVAVGGGPVESSRWTLEERGALDMLLELRASVDQDLYRRLFCISYEDLLTSNDLVNDEIVNHLTGLTTAGESARSVRDALAKLEVLRSEIYRPRARSHGALNRLIARESELAGLLRRSRREIGTLDAVLQRLQSFEQGIGRLEEALQRHESELSDLGALQRYIEQERALPQRDVTPRPICSQIVALPGSDLEQARDVLSELTTEYATLDTQRSVRTARIAELKENRAVLLSKEERSCLRDLVAPPSLLTQSEALQELGRELDSLENELSSALNDTAIGVLDDGIVRSLPLSRGDLEEAGRYDLEVVEAVRNQRECESELERIEALRISKAAALSTHCDVVGPVERVRDIESNRALAQSYLNAVESVRLEGARSRERRLDEVRALQARRGVVIVALAMVVIAVCGVVLLQAQLPLALVTLCALLGGSVGLLTVWRALRDRRESDIEHDQESAQLDEVDLHNVVRALGEDLALLAPFDPRSEVQVRASLSEWTKARDDLDTHIAEIRDLDLCYERLSERCRSAASRVEMAELARMRFLSAHGVETNNLPSARNALESLRTVSILIHQRNLLEERVRAEADRLQSVLIEARDLLRLYPDGAGSEVPDLLDAAEISSELERWVRLVNTAERRVEALNSEISELDCDVEAHESVLSSLWLRTEELLGVRSLDRNPSVAETLRSEIDGEVDFRGREGASFAVLKSERERLGEIFPAERFEWAKSATEDEFRQLFSEIDTSVSEVNAQLNDARSERERARSERARLEESSLAVRESEYLSVCEELRELTVHYLQITTASWILTRASTKYELEAQPRVLARAGELLSAFTSSRYRGIVMTADREFEVEGPGSAQMPTGRKRVAELSLGTKNQLILALRLAYLETIVSPQYVLPIIFDDVAVNTDEMRLEPIFATLMDLAASRQILYLTCHERERDHFLALQREYPDRPCTVVELTGV
jgi:uncharacterized protein YhaN